MPKVTDTIAQPLVDLLEREFGLYEALYRATQNEADALRNADIDAMITIASTKERLLGTLRLIEAERIRMAEDLATALGIAQAEPTLAILADALDGQMAQRLRDSRNRLRCIAESIVALNNRTTPILQHSRRMVRGTMAMVQHMISPEPVYSAQGDYGHRNASGQLLSGDA